MQTRVAFRSSRFPPCEEEEEIKPGLWEKRVAEQLTQKLSSPVIETKVRDVQSLREEKQELPIWRAVNSPPANGSS